MWNINALRIPCMIFTKFAEFVPCFSMRQLLKFRWICSMGYGVMGVLSSRVWLSPNFQRPVAAKLCVRPQKFQRCKNVLEVLLSPCQVRWGSDFTRRRVAKNVEFFCLFVCLFVTLLNVRDCAPDFAMKALEYRNDFDVVGYGKVCSCAPVFNFLRLLPIGDNTKC